MTRTRWIGVGLWIVCAVLTFAALGLGWAVHQELVNRPLGLGAIVALVIGAEAAFWSGGAVLGFSFFAQRGGWFRRLFRPKAASPGQGR